MSIVSRKCGEQVQLSDDISVTVLAIDCSEVKLGICSFTNKRRKSYANEHLQCVHTTCSGFYYFPLGGSITLVVHCEMGKSVSYNDTSTLTVLKIAEGIATLRLVSGCGRTP